MLARIRSRSRGLAATTLIAFAASTAVAPAAQAGIVTTEQALASAATGASLDPERARLSAALARADVAAALVARGVDPAEVEARVAALTDDEVRALNGRLDALPAGGDGLVGAAVFVFVVLLITDLLGWTDVFPFTKKGSIQAP